MVHYMLLDPLHAKLHAKLHAQILLHAPLHANYMLNYMLNYMPLHAAQSYYMFHYMPITCSIIWNLGSCDITVLVMIS